MAIRILMSALHLLKIRNLGDDVRCNDEGKGSRCAARISYVCLYSLSKRAQMTYHSHLWPILPQE